MSTFISYRRSDTGGHAMWLFDRLSQWFPPKEIFFDQDNVEAGERFPAKIQAEVDRAKVMLVVIGQIG